MILFGFTTCCSISFLNSCFIQLIYDDPKAAPKTAMSVQPSWSKIGWINFPFTVSWKYSMKPVPPSPNPQWRLGFRMDATADDGGSFFSSWNGHATPASGDLQFWKKFSSNTSSLTLKRSTLSLYFGECNLVLSRLLAPVVSNVGTAVAASSSSESSLTSSSICSSVDDVSSGVANSDGSTVAAFSQVSSLPIDKLSYPRNPKCDFNRFAVLPDFLEGWLILPSTSAVMTPTVPEFLISITLKTADMNKKMQKPNHILTT
mmetsp:Transcript_17130/g.39551  ORF Transcript_17130/g.39551 Transcript_17130/m.39551 type:complete len:260 (-) Transcript_17130:358-1137(-)